MLRFRRWLRPVATSLGLMLCATLAATACARGPLAAVFSPERSDDRIEDSTREDSDDRAEQLARLIERSRESVPASPGRVTPKGNSATAVWRNALSARGLRVVVATNDRSLWLMRDSAVLFRAPVAVGKSEGFTWAGRTYDFTTPVGRRKVLAKGTEPLWVPPDWHYLEIAVQRELKVVRLARGKRVTLGDGTFLEIRGDDVGRINQFGNFWPITPGVEMVFDGKIYIPPIGTNQRRIPEILGTRKLEIGDGYLIHGTNEEKSIGDAVSHGCIRMYNQDVERLFGLVPVGTPVYIF